MVKRVVFAAWLWLATAGGAAAEPIPVFEMHAAKAPLRTVEIPLLSSATRAGSSDEWFLQNGRLTVRNVFRSTLSPFVPTGVHTGAAVVIAPGGGFLSLAMETEGEDVARWLASHGITAFVLKYRTVKTSGTLASYRDNFNNAVRGKPTNLPRVADTPPEALSDALAALRFVRANADVYGIDPERVGFMGFSAGGVLARSVGTLGRPDAPNFVGAIYPRMRAVRVPADAPPLFVLFAADDPVVQYEPNGLVESWRAAGRPVELHLIAKGGHGFGIGHAGTSAENWLDGFAKWLGVLGFLKGN